MVIEIEVFDDRSDPKVPLFVPHSHRLRQPAQIHVTKRKSMKTTRITTRTTTAETTVTTSMTTQTSSTMHEYAEPLPNYFKENHQWKIDILKAPSKGPSYVIQFPLLIRYDSYCMIQREIP